jgi:hypothetical protein
MTIQTNLRGQVRLPVQVALILLVLGCDPSDHKIFIRNTTSKDIIVTFTKEDTEGSKLVPAEAEVMVKDDHFEGSLDVVIQDARTDREIDSLDYASDNIPVRFGDRSSYYDYPPYKHWKPKPPLGNPLKALSPERDKPVTLNWKSAPRKDIRPH